MATLRPFRQYSEHDVINMFAYDTTVAASDLDTSLSLTFRGNAHVLAGKLVKVKENGWKNDAEDLWTSESAGSVSYKNTVSHRYNLVAQVSNSNASDTNILGMLLHDVREADENGELLKFNPRKADEMQVVIKGQAVPVVTKGIFLVRGISTTTTGASLYSDANGNLTLVAGAGKVVGFTLGDTDGNGDTLIKLSL